MLKIQSVELSSIIVLRCPNGKIETEFMKRLILQILILFHYSYDFFLVSQSVRQGTVAPTSYNVIYDTSELKPDQLQVLSYKYTHLYYNWSGCVRVPAVVQYAHKLAELVGLHLHQQPSQGFDNNLYFL